MVSRWLQAPLYVGLVFVLGVVVVKFPFKIWDLMSKALIADESDPFSWCRRWSTSSWWPTSWSW